MEEQTQQPNVPSSEPTQNPTVSAPQANPVSTTSPQPEVKKSKKKLVISVVVVILLLAIAGSALAYSHFHKTKVTKSSSTTAITKKTSSTKPQPTPPSFQYVNIPISSSYENQLCPINMNRTCNVYTAGGNYYIIYKNSSGNWVSVYDNKVEPISQNWSQAGLTNNGLHYYYYDGSTGDIYVDGQDIGGAQGISNPQQDMSNLQVSNDGKSYSYESLSNANYAYYKNDKEFLAVGPNNGSVIFDSNLDNYIAQEPSNPNTESGNYSIVYDGKSLVSESTGGATVHLAISPNGQYYGYGFTDPSNNATINVNGTAVGTFYSYDTAPTSCGSAPDSFLLANSGSYAYSYCTDSNSAGGIFKFNNQSFNLSPYYAFTLSILSGLSNDGKHIYWVNEDYGYKSPNVYIGDNDVYLDGKALSLSGTIVGVNFSGDTLDIYRLTPN
jgi:hypothetical protein